MQDHVARDLEQWRSVRPELDASPMAVVGRLTRLAGALGGETAAVQRGFGLGEGEFDALAALRRAGEPHALTPGELAEATGVTSGAVTKRVDRLEAAGLVTRERVAHDGRGRIVRLTPAGLERIDAAVDAVLAGQRRLLQALRPSEQAHLAALLETWALAVETPDEE